MYKENLMVCRVSLLALVGLYLELLDSIACNERRGDDAPKVPCKFIDLDLFLLYVIIFVTQYSKIVLLIFWEQDLIKTLAEVSHKSILAHVEPSKNIGQLIEKIRAKV